MRYVDVEDPLAAAFAAIRDLEPSEAEIARVLKRARRRKRGLLRAPRLIPVIAVVAVGSGATAAAVTTLSAATGIYVHAGEPNARAIGTGEAIALGAPNDVSVGVSLTRDIPFAPGYASWRARTIAFQTTLYGSSPRPGHAFMTSSALRWQVAESAACSWLDAYAASVAAGNSAAAKTAATQIEAAPSWPAITGLSYPSGLGSVVAAVRAGDPRLVQALIDTGQAGQCTAVGPFPTRSARATIIAANRRGRQEIATDPLARKLRISDTP
jgi:hypothetical protein